MSAAGSSGDADAAPTPDLRANIAALKEKAKELKNTKIQVNKALRNAEKKRTRLKRKARELTDADLLQVMKLRQDEQTAKDEAAGREGAEDPATAKATAGRSTAATAASAAAATAAPAATAAVGPEPTEQGGRDEDLTD